MSLTDVEVITRAERHPPSVPRPPRSNSQITPTTLGLRNRSP
jgi:hypothetical protein